MEEKCCECKKIFNITSFYFICKTQVVQCSSCCSEIPSKKKKQLICQQNCQSDMTLCRACDNKVFCQDHFKQNHNTEKLKKHEQKVLFPKFVEIVNKIPQKDVSEQEIRKKIAEVSWEKQNQTKKYHQTEPIDQSSAEKTKNGSFI